MENLTQGQEKFIALQQHLGNTFFTFDFEDVYYICNNEDKKLLEETFQNELNEINEGVTNDYTNEDFYEWLLENYGCEEIQELDENEVEYENAEYLVLTDDEADKKWDEDLENYIDECILYQLPERYRQYFDRESWKSDARKDGRGNSLSRYDGYENEETVNGTTYYIYRTN